MQLFANTRIDFMGLSRVCVTTSVLLMAASLIVVLVRGLNLGIEFTGGTEIQLRYAERPDIGAVRTALGAAGMTNQVVTTIGDPDDNEVYIRLGTGDGEAADDPTEQALAVLRGTGDGRPDLNIADEPTVAALLRGAQGLSDEDAQRVAAAILAARRERAIFRSVDDLAGVPGMVPAAVEALRARATVGPVALRSQSYIGPAVGRELVQKAVFAILGSFVGMLVYIWIRFQFQWGLAAVVALVHDTLITLGFVSLFDMEVSLPVVAAFLTLIGYSVNDTVVIFDRIRENLPKRRGDPLTEVINASINQTLSRTIITSGLTWIMALGLFLFGGAALNGFALVLTVGFIVGSYSTIFVASPLLVLWKQIFDRRKGGVDVGAAGPSTPARKVPSA